MGPFAVSDLSGLDIAWRNRLRKASTRDPRERYVAIADRWYLIAWCRLREAVRAFRTDRIAAVTVTGQVLAPRPLRREDLDIPADRLRPLALI